MTTDNRPLIQIAQRNLLAAADLIRIMLDITRVTMPAADAKECRANLEGVVRTLEGEEQRFAKIIWPERSDLHSANVTGPRIIGKEK